MKFDWNFGLPLILTLLLGGTAAYYQHQYGLEKTRAVTAEHNLQLANGTIDDMQTRQRDVAALDAKYTGELADAQETIDQLERDVAAGRKRLRLNATCTANGTASATSMDDGSGPRLTDSAERDYYTLRRRIETITSQLTGLQAYVSEQCLK